MFGFLTQRRVSRAVLALTLCVAVQAAVAAVPVVTRYRSPKNPDRPIRKSTSLIVLHTTEAPAKGSLRHLSERGECHYCVTEDGTVYQIVDRYRVAFHAGTSMWNGKTDVDNFSVGIECVGYHDKAMPTAQLNAIKNLVKELQGLYKLSDDKVVTHSMVAYGEANKWQKKKHRGRKRCGMLFAMPSVRRMLGLKTRAAADPDVKAKRLVVGDETLAQALYGNLDTMRRVYGAATLATVANNVPPIPKPAPKPQPKPAAQPQPQPVAVMPMPQPATHPKPQPVVAQKPPPRPTPSAPTSSFSKLPQSIAELNAMGYKVVGTVTKNKLPLAIAGKKWNAEDTYYTIRNKVIPGNILNAQRVEAGMSVWMKN